MCVWGVRGKRGGNVGLVGFYTLSIKGDYDKKI